MGRPTYVTAELGPNDQLWIGLQDFEALSLGMVPKGANVYHEFAKWKLRTMGVPELVVQAATYTVQPDLRA